MARDETYVFEEDNKKRTGMAAFGHFLWNSETKEFCGRDGGSWAKVSLFYAIFYFLLGSFFVGMIAVFVQIMPADHPRYFGDESVMANPGLNPGLGFRPQVDVEDHMIKYTPSVSDEQHYGFKKYVNNLHNFLDAKYPDNGGFNHKAIFANSPCSSADADAKFNYDSNKACVLVKLNKIVSWEPKLSNGSDIIIRCGGEFSADKDNVHGVTYHSEGHLNDKESGKLASKYFPFKTKNNYQAPFIWVQFDVSPNTLVNIDCKAFADNIDNSDRMNRRGQTKFTLYVKSEKAART